MPAPPRFWRKIPKRYNLVGSKCQECNRVFFPPRKICPDCREVDSMEDFQLEGNGEIISYTQIHAPQEGYEEETPYFVGIIELEEGPRITGQIKETDSDEIKIGKEVRVAFRKIGENGERGIIHYGYKFELV